MKQILNYVVDLETMSTARNAVVVSAGFCPVYYNKTHDTWEVDKENSFYTLLDSIEQINLGRHVCPDTMRNFWGDPSYVPNEARDELLKSITQAHPRGYTNVHALDHIRHRMFSMLDKTRSQVIRVFGNAPSFDNAIFADLCRAYGVELPWHFRNERCARTGSDMLTHVVRPKPEIPHHALHDAIAEAQWMCDIQNNLPSGVFLLRSHSE